MNKLNNNTHSPSTRFIYWGVLLLTFLIAYIYTFDDKLAMLGDNASYYILGKSLYQGDGYVNISSINRAPNNHYPPGYPAIISVVRWFAEGIVPVKILNGAFLLLGIIFLFEFILRTTTDIVLAFVISFLTLINANLLYYGSVMMSEVPFMFLSLLSFWAFSKTDENKLTIRDPFLIVSILSMLAAYYVRTLGVALLAGYVLHFLLKKQWKHLAVYFGSFVLGALPWFIRGQSLGGGSYAKQLTMINPYQPALGQAGFGDFVDRFFNNLSRYITYEIPTALFPVKKIDYHATAEVGDWLLGLLILALIGYGLFKLPRYKWLIIGYILGTLGILMLWPDAWIGVRFIVPLIPFLGLGAYHAVYQMLSQLRKLNIVKKQIPAFVLLIMALFYISPMMDKHEKATEPLVPAWKNYFEVATWAKNNLKDDVLISCGIPSSFYLYADTYTVRFKFSEDPKELIADLEKRKVDYVVIDQFYGNTFRYLIPAVRKYPHRFEQVYHLKNPDTYLLKFKR